jgi:hypothetical protein
LVRFDFKGASPTAHAWVANELPGRSNYFFGKDSTAWRTGVKHYQRINVAEIYPGISLSYHGNGADIEYDLNVSPRSDPEQVTLSVRGSAGGLSIDADGTLVIPTALGEARHSRPIAYQIRNGIRNIIEAAYEITGENTVKFRIGEYDTDAALIIDPTISYSTYLGPLNTTSSAIAVDGLGSAYVTGATPSLAFPLQNPLYGTFQGQLDATITKFSPSGAALVYSTYIGGTGEDIGRSIAVDTSGNAFVAGTTFSANFPTASSIQGSNGGNGDAFVLKLNALGNALGYSTMLGGSLIDEAWGIAVDSNGSAFVTGRTNSPEFPTANAYQGTLAGPQYDMDGFLVKLAPSGTSFTFSTFFGGAAEDRSNSVVADGSGGAWIGGATFSENLPTLAGFQSTFVGFSSVSDGFVSHFSTSGSLLYSSYIGGSGYDAVQGIALAPGGDVVFAGYGDSAGNFPLIQPLLTSGVGSCFVAKLKPSTGLLFSTFLGGNGPFCRGVAADPSGQISVTGSAHVDFPIAGNSAVAQPHQGVFITKLASDGSYLIYSTFLSNSVPEQQDANGIAVDATGAIYVTGVGPAGWPTVNAFQTSGGSAVVAKVVDNSCVFTATPGTLTMPPGGGLFSITVTAGDSCSWNASPWYGNMTYTSLDPTFTSDQQPFRAARGNGTVGITLNSANGPDIVRTFIVAGRGVRVTQTGYGCTPSITPGPANLTEAAGSYFFTLFVNSGCTATAVSSVPWISIPSPSLVSGGSVNYSVTANSGVARTGTIMIAGLTYTVNQAGACGSSFASSGQVFPSYGGAGSVAVLAPLGCAWTVTVEGSSSVNIFSGANGTGNGTVQFSVSDNSFPLPQAATLRLSSGAGFSVTIAVVCAVQLGPAVVDLSLAAGGSGSTVVTGVNGCAWQAVSQSSWLSVTSGSPGVGNGTVNYSALPNSGTARRQGKLTIGDRSLTVNQAGTAPSYPAPRAVFRDTLGGIHMTTHPSAALSNLGGVFAGDPSTAEDMSGNVFVAARDASNAVWTNLFNAAAKTWAGWQFAGGLIQGVPSVAVTPNGTAWIASRDNFNSYWLLSYTPGIGYGAWIHLFGVFATDPVITACGDGSLYLVGKDNFNALWSGQYIPGLGFQGFRLGGGVVQGKPSIACGSDSAAYVVARDNFNSNWIARVSGNTWTGWNNGGGVTNIDPRIAALGGRLGILILDAGGAVYRSEFFEGVGTGWQSWIRVGGVLSDVAVAADFDELFFVGRAPDSALWWWRESGSQWTAVGNGGVVGALASAPR